MRITRRNLLQGGAALGAAAIVAGATPSLRAAAYAEGEAGQASAAGASASAVAGVQYGFLINLSKCVNCERCVTECRVQNKLSADTPDRRKISIFMDDKRKNVSVSTACMHCEEPSCVQVCPAGAITKGDGGIVSVDKSLCIGCKYCYQACPYEVPHYNAESMDKCDCCLGSGVAPGETPYCVRACIFDALQYGPLDELQAQVGEGARRIAEANTPSCLITT